MNNRFDTASETWDAKPGRMEMASKFAEEIKLAIHGKEYQSALEYGCGTGNVSFLLNSHFKQITLADASKGMLEKVKDKIAHSGFKHFRPLLLDLEKEELEERFDVIFTLMTLHHINNVETVMEKFTRLLLPGGMLIIGDLEKEDGDFHPHPENQEVHFGFEKETLQKLCLENNIQMKDYKVFHEVERTHTGQSKYYTLFIFSAINN